MNMNKNYKKGVAVFIAVVAVSALLLIALAISDISYKEQIISFSGRDSRIAFYAADAGVECALFHDLKGGADSLFKFSVPGAEQVGVLSCNGATINSEINANADIVITTFYFNFPDSPKSCAIVRVSKETNPDPEGGFNTKIESRGYNNSCSGAGGPTDGPRNLERSLEVTY